MRSRWLVLAWLALAAGAASAGPALRTLRLAADCKVAADDGCFGDLTSLGAWLFGVRKPSAAAPVTVEVGAGEFHGRLDCRGQGHVTFRGASREAARLVGTVDEFPFATIRAEDCAALAFEHLTVVSPRSRTGRGKAVRWLGGGDSRWTDVALRAEYVAWYDSSCPHGNALPPLGSHRFSHVSIEAGALGFFSDCGAARLEDSEIGVERAPATVLPTLARSLPRIVAGVKAGHRSDVELVRCRVEVDASAGASVGQAIALAAGADGNSHPLGAGTIELRGGAVRVRAREGVPALAARADRFGYAGPHAARIRGHGVQLDAPARAAGDGAIDWSER